MDHGIGIIEMRIAILTFCVGADYKKAMDPGMESKRAYAKRHGYTFLEGGEDVWDRKKPIPWSKIRFIQKYLDDYDFLFWCDADVILTNPDLRLEDHLLSCLPETKDMLCVFYSPLTLSWEGATTSCTSKASIKKNELEIKVLELQKQKLEGELSSKIKK